MYEGGRSLASGDDPASQQTFGHNALQNLHGHISRTGTQDTLATGVRILSNQCYPFSDPPMLRVSFNAAEADLSFGNHISNELFSIPEAFEEFLDSHASHLAGLPPFLADPNEESTDFSLHHKGVGQAEGITIPRSQSIERTEENAGLDKNGSEREAIPKMFPFASLGLPMGQFSLAPTS